MVTVLRGYPLSVLSWIIQNIKNMLCKISVAMIMEIVIQV